MIKKYTKYKFSSLSVYLKKKLNINFSYNNLKKFLIFRNIFLKFSRIRKNKKRFNKNIVYFSRFSFFYAKKLFYKRCIHELLFKKKIKYLKTSFFLIKNFKAIQPFDCFFDFSVLNSEEKLILNFNFFLTFFDSDFDSDVNFNFIIHDALIKLEYFTLFYNVFPILKTKSNNIFFYFKNNIINFNTISLSNVIFKINNIVLYKNFFYKDVKKYYKIKKYKQKLYKHCIYVSKKKYNKFKTLSSFIYLSKTYKKIKNKTKFKIQKKKNIKNKTHSSQKTVQTFNSFKKFFNFKKAFHISSYVTFKRIKL